MHTVVGMKVQVHEPWHDEHAATIDHLARRVFGRDSVSLANVFDAVLLDDDGAICNDTPIRVNGKDGGVTYQNIGGAWHRFLSLGLGLLNRLSRGMGISKTVFV
jgi:hypothetical protein